MRGIFVGIALLASTIGALAGCQHASQQPQAAAQEAPLSPPSGERMPEGVRPTAYKLELTVDPRQERFSGEVEIALVLDAPARRMWLNGQGLSVKQAQLALPDGRTLGAAYSEVGDTGWANVQFESDAPAGAARLRIVYDAALGSAGAGLYRAPVDGRFYVASQMQAVDARRVLPSFDEPRFKVPFTLAVTAPGADRVFFNTRETETAAAADGMVRHVFATTQPLPTYLLAFGVGPYDVVEGQTLAATARRGPVPLRGIAPAGKGADLAFALDHTRAFIAYYEDYFGVPYPYDKLDLIAAPGAGGAMENPGLIRYAESILLLRSDASVRRRYNFIGVHAHELAHLWFGDYVTPAWWNDTWLNEAFATWMGNKAAGALYPEFAIDRRSQIDALRAMAVDSTAAARRIRQPVSTIADINDSFDGITYSKGGGVLAMAESYLGAERFRDGVRRHMQRFPHGVATSEDFFASLSDGGGAPEVADALRSFTDQPNAPLLTASLECRAGAPVARLAQSTYRPLGSSLPDRRWRLPACVAAYDARGSHKACAIISDASAEIALPARSGCTAALMPNAGGAGYYRFALPDQDWRKLLNRFDRLAPAEQIAVIDSLAGAHRAGQASATSVLDGMAKAASARDPDVVVAAVDLAWSLEPLVPPDSNAAFASFLARAFAPRLAELERKATRSPPETIARARLMQTMALLAHDARTRARLDAAARAEIGLQAGTPPEPDLRVYAYAVLAQDGGKQGFDAALSRARSSSDAGYRAQATQGLAWTSDAELRASLWETIAGPPFGLNEAYSVWTNSLARPHGAESAWTAFEPYFLSVHERVPPLVRGFAPAFAGSACSEAGAARVRAYFTQNAQAFPGHERNLAQALERIGQCAAWRAWDDGALARAAAAR
jgi:alanyl aminopeptidase